MEMSKITKIIFLKTKVTIFFKSKNLYCTLSKMISFRLDRNLQFRFQKKHNCKWNSDGNVENYKNNFFENESSDTVSRMPSKLTITYNPREREGPAARRRPP
jgi:hypothetical protein